jgi:phosphotransferase system  glucose/maltose/N-acetylglucosamine-specific IIC component
MNQQLRPLIRIIIFVGALLYVGGIFWAGIASLTHAGPTPPEIPQIVTQAITVIGAALATHFGALFGISQFTGGNPRPIPRFYQINSWARLPSRKVKVQTAQGVRVREETPPLDNVQVLAAYLYFGSLLLALIFWALDGFSNSTADVVRNMSYSLVGVVGGVVAVVLNVKKPEV